MAPDGQKVRTDGRSQPKLYPSRLHPGLIKSCLWEKNINKNVQPCVDCETATKIISLNICNNEDQTLFINGLTL